MTPQNTTTEELKEIIYRNWKNGDEIGLYKEITALLASSKKQVVEETVRNMHQFAHYGEMYLDGVEDYAKWNGIDLLSKEK